MLFVTETFLLFFLVVYAIFWLLPPGRRLSFLILASVFFYASWSIVFTAHFLLVIGVNYLVMEIWRRRRWKWMFIALQTCNVLNIALFKYFYFLADFLGALAGLPSLRHPQLIQEHRELAQEIFLPLAISFYTFQIMAYGFDIYRGTYDEKTKLRDVVLFKMFFPQLIAGPIMRAREFLPQLKDYASLGPYKPDPDMQRRGLWLVMAGVIKKLFIADALMGLVGPVFISPIDLLSAYSGISLWLVMACAVVFIYADFSSYSDLARGLGFLLGFTIPINFRGALLSPTISEFWKRWHITFSYWIRDYVFIPLGGSRRSPGRVYFNLLFTFFLAGLWHGASYAFALWGLFMGALLVVESIIIRKFAGQGSLHISLRILRYFWTWIPLASLGAFFFAPSAETLGASSSFASVEWSFSLLHRLFDLGAIFTGEGRSAVARVDIALAAIAAGLLFNWMELKDHIVQKLRIGEIYTLPIAGILLILAILEFAGPQKDFFYFQF